MEQQQVASQSGHQTTGLSMQNLASRSCNTTSVMCSNKYHPEHEYTSTATLGNGRTLTLSWGPLTNTFVLDNDDNVLGHTGDSADSDNTNVFEILSRGVDVSYVAANLDPPNATLSSAPPPEDGVGPGMETETPLPDVLVIEWFPDGCPGTLLGVDQGLSMYEATHDMLGDLMWVLFQSQSNWEVAHWAKMCGPTSTAMTELLAIPEVCNC